MNHTQPHNQTSAPRPTPWHALLYWLTIGCVGFAVFVTLAAAKQHPHPHLLPLGLSAVAFILCMSSKAIEAYNQSLGRLARVRVVVLFATFALGGPVAGGGVTLVASQVSPQTVRSTIVTLRTVPHSAAVQHEPPSLIPPLVMPVLLLASAALLAPLAQLRHWQVIPAAPGIPPPRLLALRTQTPLRAPPQG